MWAQSHLQLLPTQTVTVIKGFFDFYYYRNYGYIFGAFSKWPFTVKMIILVIMSITCLVLILTWLAKLAPHASWAGAKLGLMAGGAIGNLIDRVHLRYVIDFIMWKATIRGKIYTWPIFNIADAALVVGIVLIILNWPKDKTPKLRA